MLTLSKNLLESNNISSLARGQKLNINGYIRSLPFTTSLNKMRRAIAIIPYDIKLYKNDEESPQDVCIVMMTAHIESPIWHQNDLAMFNLRTHVPVKYNRDLILFSFASTLSFIFILYTGMRRASLPVNPSNIHTL